MKKSSGLPNPAQASDAELVAVARRGDRMAFVEIVHRYQNLVTGVTLAILRDFSLSEDAAQEAFVLAWQKMSSLKSGEKLRPWLCQIARNTALNFASKRRPAESLQTSLIDPSPRPDESAISRDEQASLRTALNSLPEKYRLPLVLYYREDQSIKAVAEALSQSEPTVRKQLSRGRQLLKKEMATLFEFTLPRTIPGPVFTATVAGLIGAMLKPTAVAATAFSAKPITATATAMTTSQLTLTTAAIITAVCLPVGYTARALIPVAEEEVEKSLSVVTIPTRPERKLFDPALSPIVIEWQQLLATCQNNPAAFPALYQTISDLPGSLRREAFHSLLLAEWVKRDPVNGLAFVRSLEDSRQQQELFTEEWLKHDVHAAIDGLLTSEPGWDSFENAHLKDLKTGKGWGVTLGRNLNLIVEKAPERIAEVMTVIRDSTYWNPISPIKQYFLRDPDAARQLAQSFTGRNRRLAWIGIAHARSEVNFEEALVWAKDQSDPELRNDLVKAVVSSEGDRNPVLALDYLKTAPPDMDTNGSMLVDNLARNDFPAALKWAAENPTSPSLSGLRSQLNHRVQNDPEALLETLHRKGALKAAANYLNFRRGHRTFTETEKIVWEKLLEFEPSSGAAKIRKRIVWRTPPKDPHKVMELIDQLPDPKEQESLRKEVVRIVAELAGPIAEDPHDPFTPERDPDAFAEILEQASPKWQELLLKATTEQP